MERVYFTEHKGKAILVQDLTGLEDVEVCKQIFDRAQSLILKEPPKSVRLLTNVTSAHYNREGVEYMKKFSMTVTPHMKASAAVGVQGVRKIVVQTLIKLTGRNIVLRDTAEQALDWLADQ
jgi:hypothetical protein